VLIKRPQEKEKYCADTIMGRAVEYERDTGQGKINEERLH